jgi:hypothetical protein
MLSSISIYLFHTVDFSRHLPFTDAPIIPHISHEYVVNQKDNSIPNPTMDKTSHFT